MNEFAKNEYKSYITIDFSNISPKVVDIFENDSYDLDFFFNQISLFFKTRLFYRESLVIFDEVQIYPKARQLIKHLVADGRYDYVETGSLISLRKNVENIVIPSEEEHLLMYPMDFEEFLWAMGDDVTIDMIKDNFFESKPLGEAVHRRIMKDFRQYIIVGGMPQAVQAYIDSKDFGKVDAIKKNILTLYRNDVTKFAKGYESKVLAVFDQIPSQLSKQEKRFNLSSLGKSSRYRTYEDSFIWLK